MKQVCLTIAGMESSGVAGIQTDIKTICSSDVFPVGNLTCIVNIMPDGSHNFTPIEPKIISDAIESSFHTHNISAVKIGMLGTNKTIETVSSFLKSKKQKNIVLDPVLICKDEVTSEILDTVSIMKKELLPISTVITPNLFEAGVLSGFNTPRNIDDVVSCGKKIFSLGPKFVFIKGVINENKIIDVLISKESIELFERNYIKSEKVNGAGCSISSKIAAELSKGHSILSSIKTAHEFITKSFSSLQKTNTPLPTLTP